MLKWALNEPRLSYLPNTSDQIGTASLNELNHIPTTALYATNTSSLIRWHSIESNYLQPNKENQITSTPLLSCSSPVSKQLSREELSLQKLGSLKDLSNIYPEYVNATTPQKSIHISPAKRSQNRNATTLPTLDVNEYSPSCALIPGPMLALRGITIPDAYFERPRYLDTTPISNDAKTKKSQLTNSKFITERFENSPAKSLSSSQMDDSTLERMIDAIIASSHKEPKSFNRLSRQAQTTLRPSLMTPTYTPAYDPASDLDEIWWSAEQRYLQSDKISHCHREQLLCTPKTHKSQQFESSFKRRRQRPVRRKRKLKSFRKTVQKSARKLLRVGSNVTVAMPQLNEVDEDNADQNHVNLSPDSGHNSSSGDSTKTEDNVGHHHKTIDAHKNSSEEVEVTKRRLSFTKDSL